MKLGLNIGYYGTAIADNYDVEVEVTVDSLVSIIEPILIVGLGGIVFFIVLALFWPLMKLIQTLQ